MPEPNGVVNRVPLRDRIAALISPNAAARLQQPSVYPFSPGEPPKPVLPAGTDARGYVPAPMSNTVWTPRVQEGVNLTAFDQLRALSDFDLVRLAIEDCKGQILGMEYAVMAVDEDGEPPEADLARVRAWLEQPDRVGALDLRSWLSCAIEEVYVTDALCLIPRVSFGGESLGLELIDGATIRPLVDPRGRPPMPPLPAYQQIAHGRVETEFTTEEIWYCPRSRRVNSPYGRSNVEQVLWTINLALRRYMDDLSYYTNGNIPDALYKVPETWTREQITEYQRWFDEMLSGNSLRRAGNLRFVPGGADSGPVVMKSRDWLPEFNEWLARVVCYAFQVSPLPLVRLMNRATSEQAEISGTEAGVRPVAAFLADVLNRYIRNGLGIETVKFAWSTDETEDPTVVYQRHVAYLNNGALKLNEIRDDIGADRYPPEIGDRPFVSTASGPLFLDTIEEERKRKEEAAAAMAASLANRPAPASGDGTDGEDGKKPPTKPGEAPADAQGAEEGDGDGGPFARALKAYGIRVREDVNRWRRFSVNRSKMGKRLRPFSSTVLVPALRERIEGKPK